MPIVVSDVEKSLGSIPSRRIDTHILPRNIKNTLTYEI